MMNDNTNRLTRLQELSESEYEIVEGQADIRKWNITNEHLKMIGQVHDLLFDTQSNKVRYIILNTQNNEFNLDVRKVLIPIGIARIHEENDLVLLPDDIVSKINALPDYIPGDVNPGVENLVRHILTDETDTGLTGNPLPDEDTDFYSHHHFSEDAFYRQRQDRTVTNLTVIGLFDDSMEAENAVRELMVNGYSQENIDLSSGSLKETVINPQNPDDMDPGISNFINTSIDQNEEDQDGVSGGSVVIVKCFSAEEATRAASILDKCGAVEVNENT